jgi:hypothetical protein
VAQVNLAAVSQLVQLLLVVVSVAMFVLEVVSQEEATLVPFF